MHFHQLFHHIMWSLFQNTKLLLFGEKPAFSRVSPSSVNSQMKVSDFRSKTDWARKKKDYAHWSLKAWLHSLRVSNDERIFSWVGNCWWQKSFQMRKIISFSNKDRTVWQDIFLARNAKIMVTHFNYKNWFFSLSVLFLSPLISLQHSGVFPPKNTHLHETNAH